MTPPSAPLLHTIVDGDRVTACFARPTRLAEETVEALTRELETLLSRAPSRLTLDFGAVEFISSLALARLIFLNRKVPEDASLVLTNLRPALYKLMTMAGLDRLLDIDPPAQPTAS